MGEDEIERRGRRDALRLLGAGAAGVGVAWTAPAVLSTTAASAATAPPACPSCDVNLVTNGSFEDGVNGWTSFGIAFLYTDVAGFIGAPPSGPGVVPGDYVYSTNKNNSLSQTIGGLTPCVGRAYEFSVWAVTLSGLGSLTITFVGSAAPAIVIPLPNGGGGGAPLVKYTRTGFLPAGTTAVTIDATLGTGSKIFVDLVSFSLVCEA